MANTNFVPHSTPIVSSWLNDINTFFYTTCGAATSGAALATAIGAMSTTGSTATGTYDFTGATVNAATQSPGNNTTKVATTAFVTAAVAVETSRATTAEGLKAPLASPTFTGTPLTTNPTYPDNSTKIASTKYVTDAISAATLAPVTNLGAVYVNTDFVTTQSISADTTTKVLFNNLTVGYDSLSEFNTSTSIFTAAATAYYLIACNIFITAVDRVQLSASTSTGQLQYMDFSNSGKIGGSIVLHLVAGETLIINVRSTSTASIAPSAPIYSNLSIKRLV